MAQVRYHGISTLFRLALLSAALVFTTTGCLKTRAQLKDDADAGMPASVEPVRGQNSYVIDELKSEITRLSGRIEDLERQLEDKEKDSSSKEDTERLMTRITELENTQAAILSAIKKLEDNVPPPDQSESFRKGKQAYNNKDYQEAINHLNVYLKSSNGEHVEEATFLRGEAYHSLKQYKKAIIDYSKFTEKFTRSKRMPEVLWKIANSFENLEMKDEAKLFYQELTEKFPSSARAKDAKRKTAGKRGKRGKSTTKR